MAVITVKLYMRFTSDEGKDRTWSFSYLNSNFSDSNAKLLANAFIANKAAFKDGYKPTAVVTVWREEVAKEEYDLT